MQYRYPTGITLGEIQEAKKHYAEIKRQFWALVRNRPFSFFRFVKQRMKLKQEIISGLIEGKYLPTSEKVS